MHERSDQDQGLGERIKVRRLLRGWSVRFDASRAGLSHASWSRIERGLQTTDNRFVLNKIAEALECSPRDLAGTFVPMVNERGVGAVQVPALCRALVDTDPAETSLTSKRSAPQLSQNLALVRDLRHRCDYAAAATLLPDLLRDLHSITVVAGGPRQFRLFCESAFLASSILRSLGHPGEAWLAAERCHEAAERAEDPVLLAYAQYARASVAISCGSYSRGLTLTERAVADIQNHTDLPSCIEVLGTLCLTAAYANQALGRPSETTTWISEATGIARSIGETSTLGLFFGPANVNIWRIGIETDAERPRHAIEIANMTNPTKVGAKMRLVYFYADTARAYSKTSGRELDACRYLMIADRVAPQHIRSSPSAKETARILLERVGRRTGASQIRAMCERLGVAD